jgi:hypothetical protein
MNPSNGSDFDATLWFWCDIVYRNACRSRLFSTLAEAFANVVHAEKKEQKEGKQKSISLLDFFYCRSYGYHISGVRHA